MTYLMHNIPNCFDLTVRHACISAEGLLHNQYNTLITTIVESRGTHNNVAK